MLRRALGLALVFLVVPLAAATSCAAITSYDCFSAPCTSSSVGSDAAPDGGREAGCALRKPPPPPVNPPVGLETPPQVMILTDLSLELPEGDAGLVRGFDQDDTCTCAPEDAPDPSSCVNASAAPKGLCDDPGGVDRQTRKLFSDFVVRIALGDDALKDALGLGRLAIILQLTGYNGQSSDGDLRVDLLNGVGLKRDGGGLDRDAAPSFGPDDSWLAENSASLTGGVALSSYFARGYVTNGTLVAKFEQTTRVAFRALRDRDLNASTIDLVDLTLVADVEVAGADILLRRGVFSGKWSIPSALRLLQAQTNCTRDSFYEDYRKTFCRVADISTDTPNLRNAPCNAVSFTLGFSTTKTKVVGTTNQVPAACDGGIADDTCAR